MQNLTIKAELMSDRLPLWQDQQRLKNSLTVYGIYSTVLSLVLTEQVQFVNGYTVLV